MLKKFGFGRTTATDNPAPADSDARRAVDAPPGAHQLLLTRHREMVRVAVKGTLNEHGIGATWIGFEVELAAAPDVLAITLVVQEWREELLRYLPALQRRIVASRARVQPAIDHTRHKVSWKFAPDCGCTVADLPPATSWSAKAAAATLAGGASRAPAPAGKTSKFDLPPSDLDQIRDERDDIPSTFAATSPGFLNSQPLDMPTAGQPGAASKPKSPKW